MRSEARGFRRAEERVRDRRTAQEEQARERRRDELAAKQWIEDLRAVMSTAPGRRLLAFLIWDMCGVGQSTYRTNSRGVYLQGRSDVGLELLDDLENGDVPLQELLLKMHTERAERKRLAAVLQRGFDE